MPFVTGVVLSKEVENTLFEPTIPAQQVQSNLALVKYYAILGDKVLSNLRDSVK